MDRIVLTGVLNSISNEKLKEVLLLLRLNSCEARVGAAVQAICGMGIVPSHLVRCLEALNLNLPAQKIREMDGGASSSIPRAPGYTLADLGFLTRCFQLASADGLRQLLEVCGLFSAAEDPTHVAITFIQAGTPQDEIIRALDILHQKRAADYLRHTANRDTPIDRTFPDHSPPTDRSPPDCRAISNYDTPIDRPEMQDERANLKPWMEQSSSRGIDDVRKILIAFGVAPSAQELLFTEGLDIYTIDGLDDAMLIEAGVPKIRRKALLHKLQSIKKEVNLS